MNTEETWGGHVLTPKPGVRGDGNEDTILTVRPNAACQGTNSDRSHRPVMVQVSLASKHGPLSCLTMASREGVCLKEASLAICS